jgi:hypothetical protein
MGKSKIQEKFSLSVEGVLDNEADEITLDVEEIGTKNLRELLKDFNSKNVKISVTYGEEIIE